MAVEVTVPRLGWNMDEGVFVGWLKADGDAVKIGEPLYALEGEKATQDIEALDDGTLRIPPDGPRPGDRVAVGAVVAYLLQTDESLPLSHRERVAAQPPGEGSHPPERKASREPLSPTSSLTRPLRGHPLPGREKEKLPRSSPLARRIARELGVDWTRLRGNGRSGRVRKADVLAAAERGASARSLPLSPARRAIAARLAHSQRTAVPVTLTTTVDATHLVGLRRQFQASGGAVPGYTDIVVKLAALALVDHPTLNARLEDDRIVLPEGVHIGMAVDVDAGLRVPVVCDAASLGLKALASRTRELVERARNGDLQAAEMQGGTFTVTNLGGFGIEAFTPVINPPECAILGMGRIVRRPAVREEQIVARDEMVLSLTFDHRIVDGAPAARFLQHLTRMIENPAPWLVS